MNKKIRVLHIAEAAGGVERYLETLFKYNDNDQVENILICSQNYDYKKFKSLTSRAFVLKMQHDVSFIDDLQVEKTIRNIIKQVKPDIVYAHSSKAGAFARIADLGIKNKVIYNPHGWAFNMQQSTKKKEMYKWVEKISAHFCDKIICISDAEKKSALRENICPSYKLQVIYNGIDLDGIKNTSAKSKSELNIPENTFVIGQVGRLSKQKAPDTFVKAAKLIKKEIPNAYFLMVGDGELRSQIEEMIHQFELQDSFLITGWVDDPIAYMKIMDIGCLLSRWEGFGLVLPEYMACGVPIVATNVDAIPNIIRSNENGILIDKNESISILKAVETLYDNAHFRQLVTDKASKIVIEKYDADRVVDETLRIYKSITKIEE